MSNLNTVFSRRMSVCMLVLSAGLAAPSLAQLSGPAWTATMPNGVAAGETTTNGTLLWTRSTQAGMVNFEVSTSPTFASIVASASVNVTTPDQPVTASIAGLVPGTQYYYRATDASASTVSGQFSTRRAAGTGGGLRFGASGDWRGENAPYPFMRNAPGRNLDTFVMLGDTIYADAVSPAGPTGQARTLGEFRALHNEVTGPSRGVNFFADLRRTVSTIATIDDHEVTNDFAGYDVIENDARFNNPGPVAPGTRLNQTPLYRNGLQAFQEFHPIQQRTYNIDPANPSAARVNGVADLYRATSFGDSASMFTLDARSFRDTGLAPVANPLDPAQVGAYLAASFTPGRTMLGNPQIARLQQDLLSSVQRGETWRFINVSEPIQNLGVLNASDRFEGYAAERAALLNFIRTNNIPNVVFISADIHGTLVNNLTAPAFPGGPQLDTGAFEITTGSGAYDAPFGPTVAGLAAGLGIPGALPLNAYLGLSGPQQEGYIQTLINAQVQPLGYTPLGIEAGTPGINATLTQGTWTATNTYGWTEFDIAPGTQLLTVTTYGIPWYTDTQLAALIAQNPNFLDTLQPQIMQQFTVSPQFVPTPGAAGVLVLAGMVAGRRRRG